MADNILTAEEVPERNKRRSVATRSAANKARQSRKKVISRAKACKILRDGEVRGEKLTDKARGFMAARCEGRPIRKSRS